MFGHAPDCSAGSAGQRVRRLDCQRSPIALEQANLIELRFLHPSDQRHGPCRRCLSGLLDSESMAAGRIDMQFGGNLGGAKRGEETAGIVRGIHEWIVIGSHQERARRGGGNG